MFKNLSNLSLGYRITAGFLLVVLISLAGGIAIGKNINSSIAIFAIAAVVLIAMAISWFVVKTITASIGAIVDKLTNTTENVDMISKDLNSTGRRLAEGSTEQAASIQETSSTLEESASMLHQTTQNTREADVLAKKTKNAANQGNVEMQTMLSSMEELKKSSTEISKIIKVIDEIAFQTNILSLNAAVEAARAGDAGKGFAVVAEEVRNLAQRSAQAAKDTAGIIERNIDLSERCLNITEQVGQSLSKIKDETNHVSELLDEISSASQEQEIGIGQINQAMSQMEIVIQANATTAQESASSAEQLQGYAGNMKEVVSSLISLIRGANFSIAAAPKFKKPTFISEKKAPVSKIAPTKSKPAPAAQKPSEVKPEAKRLQAQKPAPQPTRKPAERKPVEKRPRPQVKPEVKDVQRTSVEPEVKKVEPISQRRPEDVIPLDDF